MKSIKTVCRVLTLFCSFLLVTSCSSQVMDISLETKSFTISDNKVAKKQEVPHSKLTGTYQGIDDMYGDSDYVVSGVVKDIAYFEENNVLLRKINVLVNKSYMGDITENTLISILENDGYLRLKSLYAELKKAYEEKYGNKDKEKEDAYLFGATYMSDIKDIENDMLIQYYYIDKEDSKIGDELLLFLTDSSDDTYKEKKVKLDNNAKLVYPKGAYSSLGIGMGKFTRIGDFYKRYNLYYTPDGTNSKGTFGGMEQIRESYSVIEMEYELKKLSNNTNINTVLKNDSNQIISNSERLGMLNFVLPDKLSLDKSEKVLYYFIDEKGEKSGFISSTDYVENFDFLIQMPNHSSVTNDEYIDIPLGKCRLITLDADNGTAASGIVGTHNVYYASVSVKGTAIYMLDFTMNDKKPETKKQFIEILNKLSIK